MMINRIFLTKQTGEFLAPKTLRDRFARVNTMENFLGGMKHFLREKDLLNPQLTLDVNYRQTLRWKVYHLWSFHL